MVNTIRYFKKLVPGEIGSDVIDNFVRMTNPSN